MAKPEMYVTLVCGPDCDMETQAIRASLEYFGARVMTHWVGRPSDLMDVLSGEDVMLNTDLIILNFHGDEGRFIMPELDESVYEEGEPRGNFGPDEIARFTKLAGHIVIGNGCSLGDPALAQAFLGGGCRIYIGPDDYPFGNTALMFALRLCYEMIQNKKSIQEAFAITRAMDPEMDMYRLYEQAAAKSLDASLKL
ncbi:delta-aminolevulinic acid dehydratase [Paenibacillus sp. 481]|uniref:delta-aminolevulinic acid dehydratase n=1 Tax=Paenibacillus sp. 481 TaxID=2835869 RepID=UPI001E5C5D96|nr:delta-aminolevulinic acid dehydratase [Paenibacillus sp. 481]UHA72732.1 delta-aminolevulinic acid dehydratase [Paenibacillus sp. 481]